MFTMSLKSINILVDERPVQAHLGYTIMQTCSNSGVDVPRFCYHDKLLIAGNCRICLVEVTGSKKLVASCAVHVSDNMSIYTNTARVRIARQNVLEFLLANHPLDCPICDQGGECDLQDITTLFGADRGRFYENEKRAVLNKDFGPLIRTSMNRCIHCTRCVRFLTMSSGVSILGTLGRGSATEIGTYINQFVSDELSGNITDLCPVGALTSKPYSFKARPWELTSVRSLDIFDSLNSPLLLDLMANKICRILPYANDSLNECWLTNKARYAYDGLFVQRLDTCLLRISVGYFISNKVAAILRTRQRINSYIKLSWSAAFCAFFGILLAPSLFRVSFIVGNHTDLESTLALFSFTKLLGSGAFFHETSLALASHLLDWDFLYLFNTSLVKIAKFPSFCLLVGVNLRLESPLLNLRLNRLVTERETPVFKLGGATFFSAYKVKLISNSVSTFFLLCEFKHVFCKNFYVPSFGYKPFILVGGSILFSYGTSFCYGLLAFIKRIVRVSAVSTKTKLNLFADFCYFGFLHQYSAAIHFLSLGGAFNSLSGALNIATATRYKINEPFLKTKLVYSVGADRFLAKIYRNSEIFFIYQGTHGTVAASCAHLILPTSTYVERAGVLKNLLGVTQKMDIAVRYAFGLKSDVEIFRGLALLAESTFFKTFFNFSYRSSLLFNTTLLLNTESLLSAQPYFFNTRRLFSSLKVLNLRPFYYILAYNAIESLNASNLIALSAEIKGKIFSNIFSSSVVNYYGDPSSNLLVASKTMTLCSTLNLKKNFSFTNVYY